METLAHGIAGSVGGMVAMAILYPLDQIKTIMQVEGQEAAAQAQAEAGEKQTDASKKKLLEQSFAVQAIAIVKAKKWAVYQGHVSTQVALGGSNFVYFFCYNGLKNALIKRLNNTNKALSGAITPMQNLALSCLAGIINVYITAPLWVMNMRLKSKDHAKYTGMIDCIKKIIQTEGLLSLWNGTLASLMLVSNPVIHYVSYERMKTALQLRRIASNPKVAQSLMRVQAAATAKKEQDNGTLKTKPVSDSLTSCLAQIYKEQGVAGYFAGLEAKLLQTVLTAAISLVTYEKLLAIILVLLRQTKPKAIAKAVA
ncbi:hypothetical protein FI667_g12723, partial [Globisporangium splendens]